MRIRVYLDEDVPFSFAQALSNRGVDTLQTQLAGNIGKSDNEQLECSAKQGRTILTHNRKDFILLHNKFSRLGKRHNGIIVSDQLPVGVLLKRFMKLWFSVNAEDMNNRPEFLSAWK